VLKRKFLLVATGITILSITAGIIVFRKGIYSFWDVNVKRINTEEAQKILLSHEPFILDTRTPEEFNVSHLQGAIRFEEGIMNQVPKDRPVLIYCTIGVRSNRVAKELSDKGFSSIYDMKEGILGWANNQLPVIDTKNRPTDSIHTYNKSFAHLLKHGKAVY